MHCLKLTYFMVRCIFQMKKYTLNTLHCIYLKKQHLFLLKVNVSAFSSVLNAHLMQKKKQYKYR